MYPVTLLAGTLLVVLLALVLPGVLERRIHQRNLARIPIRIHVNGTRGKSSTVRLIAAGLRRGGIRTFAKTSGTLPFQILPDETEHPVNRASRQPNVIEQTRIVALAAAYGAQALVVECMAVRPELQSVCELMLIRSTHGVITNVGPDHLDVMGPTEADAACALAGTTPVGGTLFTTETRFASILAQAARDRGAKLVVVGADCVGQVRPEELAGFAHVEHPENVALALRVCEELGVTRATALRGMWAAPCDAGAMTIDELRRNGKRLVFVNGFAANDPDSTRRVWDVANERVPDGGRIVLVNCRADRPLRSWQLGVACAAWTPLDHCLVMGWGSALFTRAAVRHGMPARRIRRLGRPSNEEILRVLLSMTHASSLVVGVGNVGKDGKGGLEFARFWQQECARA